MQEYLDQLKDLNHKYEMLYDSRMGNSFLVRPIDASQESNGPQFLTVAFAVKDQKTEKSVVFARRLNARVYAGRYGLSIDSPDDTKSMLAALFRATLEELKSRLDSFTNPFEIWGETNEEDFTAEKMPDYYVFRDRPCEHKVKVPGSLKCEVSTANDRADGGTTFTLCNRCGFPELPFRCEYLFVKTSGFAAGGGIKRNAFVSCGRGVGVSSAQDCALRECFMPITVSSDQKFSGLVLPRTIQEAAERHEDSYIELKGPWDENTRKTMRKDVAAFSSCEGGVIYIGISNDGSVVGIPAATPVEVDDLKLRIFGVVMSQIKPLPTVSVDTFPWQDGEVVARIIIFPGDAPVYYYNEIPYIRRGSASVPATPEEVIQMVRNHLLRNKTK